jgi:hypothetical protein
MEETREKNYTLNYLISTEKGELIQKQQVIKSLSSKKKLFFLEEKLKPLFQQITLS